MNKIKKAVHITTVHPVFDVRIFHKECMSLVKNNYELVLIACSPTSVNTKLLKLINLPPPKNRFDRMTRLMFYVVKFALKEKADIYHFHDPELIFVGFLLKLCNKKVIYDVHENVPEDIRSKEYIPAFLKGVLSKLASFLEFLSGHLFDAIITVTPTIAKRFPPDKTFLVRNFPRPEEFTKTVDQPYGERANDIVYAGGLSRKRGIEEIINAVNIVSKKKKVRLYLAGKFIEKDFEEAAKSLQGWDLVHYLGWVDREHLSEVYSKARIGLVILQPDKNYISSYPIKLFEYMAAGIPVIASNFPLWQEIIDRAECGLVVDPLDVSAIAKALEYLLEHPDIAEEMGAKGRQAVANNYLWDSEAETLFDIYSHLIRKNKHS